MKVGDLVKFKIPPAGVAPANSGGNLDAIGIIVDVTEGSVAPLGLSPFVLVSWNWADGKVGRNFRSDLEVINESR